MPSKRSTDDLSIGEVRSRQYERAMTISIVGLGVRGDRALVRGLRGVQHCLCVQDSPESPCPCSGPLIWVSEEDIVAERPAGRRDREGRELTTFAVRRDARLVVDRPRSISALAYMRIAALSARLASHPSRMSSTPPRVIKKEDGDGLLSISLKDAFLAGYEFAIAPVVEDLAPLGAALGDIAEEVVSAATDPWEGFLNQ
jgi:hypothetical protein